MNFEKQQYITIEDALSQAHILISCNDARILLQHVLKTNHAHIITHPEQNLTPIQIHTFQLLVKRRARIR